MGSMAAPLPFLNCWPLRLNSPDILYSIWIHFGRSVTMSLQHTCDGAEIYTRTCGNFQFPMRLLEWRLEKMLSSVGAHWQRKVDGALWGVSRRNCVVYIRGVSGVLSGAQTGGIKVGSMIRWKFLPLTWHCTTGWRLRTHSRLHKWRRCALVGGL